MSKYSAKDIKVLNPIEGVRTRPGMYIGTTDEFGILQITKEIVDNSIDEALAGHCDQITVNISQYPTIQVRDNGRGIPVENHPKHPKKSTLEIVFTHLHAGGKLDKKGAYEKGSIGTHGVGAAVTNALSSSFKVRTWRNRVGYSLEFQQGVPIGKIKKLEGTIQREGTVVSFVPDLKIFGKKAKLPKKDLRNMLELSAYLHPKVTFSFQEGAGNLAVFKQPKGVSALLEFMIKNTKSKGVGKPLVLQQTGLDIVLQWTTHDSENIKSYVCGSPTPQGGTHMKGLFKAINDAIKPYKPKRGDGFKPEDLRVGMQGVVNLTVVAPEFEGQVKEKLASKDATEIVYNAAFPALKKFFDKNQTLVKNLVKRAVELAAGRQKFVANRKMIAALKINKSGKVLLPAKLTQSLTKDYKKKELYICEGDSASGTAKKARDPEYQEILALSGKIVNIYKDKQQKAAGNAAIIDILKSVGFDPTIKDPTLKLRVGKIILLSDPDVDGKHINVLLLSLFQKVLPELYDKKVIYVADAPLFNAYYRGTRYFGESRKDLLKKAPSGVKPEHIQRIKGWGEVNAPVLRDVAFDPKTRNLTQVTPLSLRKIPKFEGLVGEGTKFRRELLGLDE